MKALFGFVSAALFVVSAQAQSGFSFGQVEMGGTECLRNSAKATLRGGVLRIPVSSSVTKSSGTRIERGTCAFTLPIQVARGYRLVLSDLSALGSVNLSRGTTSRIDLEVFEAGDRGEVLTQISGSPTKQVRKTIHLEQDGDVVRTACGEGINLRGNTAILLQGDARASASFHSVELAVDVERCN